MSRTVIWSPPPGLKIYHFAATQSRPGRRPGLPRARGGDSMASPPPPTMPELPISPVALALLVGALAAGLCSAWRRDGAAGPIVAGAALVALLLLLRPGEAAPGAETLLARPLVGALVVGLFSLAAHRALAGAPPA